LHALAEEPDIQKEIVKDPKAVKELIDIIKDADKPENRENPDKKENARLAIEILGLLGDSPDHGLGKKFRKNDGIKPLISFIKNNPKEKPIVIGGIDLLQKIADGPEPIKDIIKHDGMKLL